MISKRGAVKKHILLQKSGAALLAVLMISAAVIAILKEVWISSQREHISARQELSRLQARYAALSGMELSMIRLYAYKGAQQFLGQKIDFARPYIDMLWSPLVSWPLPLSENLSESGKSALRQLSADSFLKESYTAGIFPEDGRIDLNSLSSHLGYLREFSRMALRGLIDLQLEENEALRTRLEGADFEEILNNLADWTDEDSDSRSGGDESLIEEGAAPLNRSFASVGEIRKVPGVTEDIFQLLKPWVAVYGVSGININYAEKKMLMALGAPEGLAEEILMRTAIGSEAYQPFLNEGEFCSFAEDRGADICGLIKERHKTTAVLRFGLAAHFRASAAGRARNIISEHEALLYDPAAAIPAYKSAVREEEKLFRNELVLRGEMAPPQKKKPAPSSKNPKSGPRKPNRETRLSGAPPFFVMFWTEGG